jgi:inorganic pyrophosphatase
MFLTDKLIVGSALIGLAFAYFQFTLIKKIKLYEGKQGSLLADQEGLSSQLLVDVYEKVFYGAGSFLRVEYSICTAFCLCFGALIYGLIYLGAGPLQAKLTAIAFLCGAFTSMFCGFLGMKIATFSNARTTKAARLFGYKEAFNTAFRAGGVMGYALCSFGILVLWILLTLYRRVLPEEKDWAVLMDCVAGYGLGGSTVAMFGRVGGGIFTKAADVGADLCGKVVNGLDEDDPRNPATVADNVGDNVGDIAGMGSDLFGSFAESTCAALVIAAAGTHGVGLAGAGWDAVMFPLAISAAGIIVCMLCSFVATNIDPVTKKEKIEWVLKVQMVLTAFLMLPVVYYLAKTLLPANFVLEGVALDSKGMVKPVEGTPFKAFICVAGGTVGGLIIGLVTEYFTSHTYTPVRELATACKSGAAVNIIFGMALGYKSCIIPVFVLAANIYSSFLLLDLYGIALAALGMLSTLATGLTIDGFGPVADNAGGLAEMAGMPSEVRETTDDLDAAGNTTAAIGKGFAIGSAALVSLALYGAFVIRLNVTTGVNVLAPITFAALLVGAMIPYWFAALTMKSVGKAADMMVQEVARQFTEIKDSAGRKILDDGSQAKPDYDACIAIATNASLSEMIAPGALVIFSPLIFGTFFGTQAVFGLLTGSLVSSVQLAISMSNSGGAWDNCKKYIKGGYSDDPILRGKGLAHDAAVTGDTVGDPFKDTSGPALNIVMKLQAIVSLVFAEYFLHCNGGMGLLGTSA